MVGMWREREMPVKSATSWSARVACPMLCKARSWSSLWLLVTGFNFGRCLESGLVSPSKIKLNDVTFKSRMFISQVTRSALITCRTTFKPRSFVQYKAQAHRRSLFNFFFFNPPPSSQSPFKFTMVCIALTTPARTAN